MLELVVHKTKIETKTPYEYIRGTVGAKCHITFDDFWKDYDKYVVFKANYIKCKTPITIIVDEMDLEVEVPYEILQEAGSCKIGVYGTTAIEVLPTLWSDPVNVLVGTDTFRSPAKYTPNQIDQLRRALSSEKSARELADKELQKQIDECNNTELKKEVSDLRKDLQTEIEERQAKDSEVSVQIDEIFKIIGGSSIGVDTSDATAYAEDIVIGKTAYARGRKLVGTCIPSLEGIDAIVLSGGTSGNR